MNLQLKNIQEVTVLKPASLATDVAKQEAAVACTAFNAETLRAQQDAERAASGPKPQIAIAWSCSCGVLG